MVPAAAVASTAYTPARTLAGAFFVIVTVPLCPALRVRDAVENEPDHPDGWLELRLNRAGEHPAESLFVTLMLYVTLPPARVLGFRGEALTAGLASVHGT